MIDSFIPLSEPFLCGNEWTYVKECLDTGWISSVGPFVDRFEKEIGNYTDAKHAVACVNGTAALHTALLVAGLQPHEEVLVSTLTFVAPANAIAYARAVPVFMDANPKTWQMDVCKLEKFLQTECEQKEDGLFNKQSGRRVRAILPVHILGFACDMDCICNLAKKYRLKIVEDAAEGMGVRYKGRHVGTFGDVGALSFNGNKIITTGGGGMVITNDKDLARYARYLTTQAKDDPLEYVHNEIGFNYRLTNVSAAIGVAQLEKLDEFIAKKRAIASFYKEALKDVAELTLMPEPVSCEPTYWLYTVLLSEKSTLERRQKIIQKMNENKIGVRPFWHTIHDLPLYEKAQAYEMEHATRLYERGICLPSSVNLNPDDLKKVVTTFLQIIASK